MSKFYIYKDAVGQYRWRLIAVNGEIVAIGEAYVSKQSAIRSAQLIKILAPSASIIDSTTILVR